MRFRGYFVFEVFFDDFVGFSLFSFRFLCLFGCFELFRWVFVGVSCYFMDFHGFCGFGPFWCIFGGMLVVLDCCCGIGGFPPLPLLLVL